MAQQLQKVMDLDEFKVEIGKKLACLEKRLDRIFLFTFYVCCSQRNFRLLCPLCACMWLQSLCNSWPTRGEAAKLSEISRIEDKLRQLQETVFNLEIQTKPAVDFNRFRYAN